MSENLDECFVYYCRQNHKDLVSPDCPRHIGDKKADDEAWKKICDALDKPGLREVNNAIPKTPEEQHRVFLLKKRLLEG